MYSFGIIFVGYRDGLVLSYIFIFVVMGGKCWVVRSIGIIEICFGFFVDGVWKFKLCRILRKGRFVESCL